jgi:camphor 5-monooxygenase
MSTIPGEMMMATVPEKNSQSAARARARKPDHVPTDRVYEIDMYALEGIEEGYHEAWHRIIEAGLPDLIWTPFTGGHWIATNGDSVKEIYADPTRFSSEVIFLPKEAGEKYQMVPTRMDPPEHTPYRKSLDKGLKLSQIRKVEDRIRQVSAELIEGFCGNGGCDFSAEYAGIFPVRVFMALCDLPMEDVPLLNRYARMMTRPEGNTPEEMAADLEAGNNGFFAYVAPVIEKRRGNDGEDLISLMVNNDIEGVPIEHDKAIGLIALLLLGGLDTVVNFLSFMMIYLARHPDLVAELRDDSLKLMRGAEEMFRRFPVVAEARMVAKDQVYKGTTLKKGDMILIPTAMHGLDDAHNSDPLKVILDRRSVAHSTFGGGPHRCAGMHLARMEVIVTLEEWLKRIPEFSIGNGELPRYFSGTIAAVENVSLIWPIKS